MMKKLFLPVSLLLAMAGTAFGQFNDHIFPPANAAKTSINFDARGFLINGKRTFIASACLEYARMPRAQWADRLMRLKMAGYNCVEFCTFWNFHEPLEGQFNFTGDHDLDAFLKLVKQMGMYAIARVGPYTCAEWNFGGYPIWLSFKPGVLVREPNDEFQAYYDKYFDQLIPIVADNQISRGGAVILVQLENENPTGWGTEVPNSYYAHLQRKVLSLGLQVPYFFSGLHHAFDPAAARNVDDPKRPNPWFTTEIYTRWFNVYGPTAANDYSYGRKTWNIVAHGGNGYSHYMAYGGSNFDYNNSDADAASYDYGAPVGQAGDLRPIYYQVKRAALFARSFGDILENSSDASQTVQGLFADTSLKANLRKSPAGSILFIDNPTNAVKKTRIVFKGQSLPSTGTINLQPQDIFPVIYGYQLTPAVKIDFSAAKILGISRQGRTTTLVTYGQADDAGEFRFSASAKFQLMSGNPAFLVKGNKALLRITYHAGRPTVYVFKNGIGITRIIALSTELADRTWFADTQGNNVVVTGPEYVAGITLTNGVLQLQTERSWTRAAQYPIWVYGENAQLFAPQAKAAADHRNDYRLNGPWQVRNAALQAGARFDDSKWLKSDMAQLMGADNDLSCDAWYRMAFDVQQAGTYRLNVTKGGGRATVFVDSLRVAGGDIKKDSLQFSLTPGQHTMAVFVAHDGRDHIPLYMGSLQAADPKGLGGPVDLFKLNSQAPKTVSGWKVIKGAQPGDINNIPAPDTFATAAAYAVGQDGFNLKAGYAWFGAVIPAGAAGIPETMVFESLDDIATVFINGKKVGTSTSYQSQFAVQLDGLIDPSKKNYVAVFIQNIKGPGGIAKPVDLQYHTLKGWRMAGGPGNYASETGYATLIAGSTFNHPVFYRNAFKVSLSDTLSHPVFRVITAGLGHGSVWVNGHNLGRYPETIPVNGLYIPECWLINGENSLVIYDEDGNLPAGVAVQAEVAASRDIDLTKFRLSGSLPARNVLKKMISGVNNKNSDK